MHEYDRDQEEAGNPMTVAEKSAVVNRGRHERKHRQSDRDIRKLAGAILQIQENGTLNPIAIESLVEILRRG